MQIDQRSFPYSVSAQLITDPMQQIGISSNNIPKFVCYDTPAYKIIKTTKVLWDNEEEYESYFTQALNNSDRFTGSDLLTGATISNSYIYLDSDNKKYSGTIQRTTFPSLGSYHTPYEEITTKKVNVIGFTARGLPIWGDEYIGESISIKKTISGLPPAIVGRNNEIKKRTISNPRYVNNELYVDVNEEIQVVE